MFQNNSVQVAVHLHYSNMESLVHLQASSALPVVLFDSFCGSSEKTSYGANRTDAMGSCNLGLVLIDSCWIRPGLQLYLQFGL